MKTSIILLTLNNLDQTKRCVQSIRTFTDVSYELIFVDNGSVDGTVAWLERQPDIRLIRNSLNRGFAAACNQGATLATGDSILLLNNDTIVSSRWLPQMLSCLYSDDRIGMVGPRSNFALPLQNIPFEWLGEIHCQMFSRQYNVPNPGAWENLTALSGFCLLLRREVWERLGGLDETFGIGGYEDIDASYRVLRMGMFLRLAGDTFVYHEGNRSFEVNALNRQNIAARNRRIFLRKWGFNPERLILTTDPVFLPDRYASPHPHHHPRAAEYPSGWYAEGVHGCVYRIERRHKRPLANYETFCRLKLSADQVAQGAAEILQSLPDGVAVDWANFPSGYPDIFLAADPYGALYLISHGIQYPIRDQMALDGLGMRREDAVLLDRDKILSLPAGWPVVGGIGEDHELPDYQLYRGPDGGIHYSEGQHLRPLVWEQTLSRFGWRMDRAIAIPPDLFSRTPKGFPIY